MSSDGGIKVTSCNFSGAIGTIYVGFGAMYGGRLSAYGCSVLYDYENGAYGVMVIKATNYSGYITGWYGQCYLIRLNQ